MKKYILLSLLSILLSTSIYAEDFCDKNYIKAFGGANFLDLKSSKRVKYHTGGTASVILGRYVLPSLRAEAEVAYRHNAISYKFHTKETFYSSSTATMINLLGDLPFSPYNIRPFIGGGLGCIINHETYFSWQAILGLSYSICPNTAVSFEYKLLKGREHAYNHSVGLGFSYRFSVFGF